SIAEGGKGVERPVNNPPVIKAPRPFEQQQLLELAEAIAAAERDVKADELRLPPSIPTAAEEVLESDPKDPTPAEQAELARDFRPADAAPVTEADRALERARKAKTDYEAALPTVMVMAELDQPRETFVLKRGQYDQHGARVDAGLPAMLPALP